MSSTAFELAKQAESMPEFGIRNWTLLKMGLKTCGASTDAYFYIEEELYVNEANLIYKFIEWIVKNNDDMPINDHNYEERWNQFLFEEIR